MYPGDCKPLAEPSSDDGKRAHEAGQSACFDLPGCRGDGDKQARKKCPGYKKSAPSDEAHLQQCRPHPELAQMLGESARKYGQLPKSPGIETPAGKHGRESHFEEEPEVVAVDGEHVS